MILNFQTLRDICGRENADKIAVEFAGQRLFIPRKPDKDGPLSRLIGHASALKLAARFGGWRWEVPVAEGKRIRIERMLRLGHAPQDIARMLGCSQRYVMRVRSRLAAQPDIETPKPGQGVQP